MNNQIFVLLIESYNRGEVKFNHGTNWSFLFNNHWYPARSFMLSYYQQIGQNTNINLHRAVFELSKFMPVTTSDITFKDNFPVINRP